MTRKRAKLEEPTSKGWVVGQEVFVAELLDHSRPRESHTYTYTSEVSSLGRKWGHLTDGGKFDLEDGRLSEGSYVARFRVYFSLYHYQQSERLRIFWEKLYVDKVRSLGFRPPKGATYDLLEKFEQVVDTLLAKEQ